MACCLTPSDPTTKEIDKMLVQDHNEYKKTIKLLLLGAGESGKSTIFKQMKIINTAPFDNNELANYKHIIFRNVLDSIRELISNMSKLDIKFGDATAEEHANFISAIPEAQIVSNSVDSIMAGDVGRYIKVVWNDAGIKECYKQRSNFQLIDSAEYYLNDVDRICNPSYLPTQQDVLRSRMKTVGIVEADFLIDRFKFKMVDVGGQRNERRKWIHAFDEVTAIIFVTSLSEYDQKLFENDQNWRMHESVMLFEEMCNSKFLKNTSMLLFFNKKDLFDQKIKYVNPSVCYPDEYKDGNNPDKALDFIQKKFLEKNRNPSRQIFHRVTQATDTENIKTVFNLAKAVILRVNLGGMIS
ncbi:guanine nucleotide-binding protein G(i) subunit alpha [Acrasis kona]|uniref:Guanine nucleotide-binding protein G(I) subunit alpha n=1 Tax=Acrasis kona TaxID=1008807 RepID=A0AAW2ZNZ2_9EUKA